MIVKGIPVKKLGEILTCTASKCWSVEKRGGKVELSCSLYVCAGIDGEWLEPEAAAAELEKIVKKIHDENPAAVIEGAAEFSAFGNWDSDNPEDQFGVIRVENGNVICTYGEHVYDVRELELLRQAASALAAYVNNDIEAADEDYAVLALEQAGITPELLRYIGLSDLADTL